MVVFANRCPDQFSPVGPNGALVAVSLRHIADVFPPERRQTPVNRLLATNDDATDKSLRD